MCSPSRCHLLLRSRHAMWCAFSTYIRTQFDEISRREDRSVFFFVFECQVTGWTSRVYASGFKRPFILWIYSLQNSKQACSVAENWPGWRVSELNQAEPHASQCRIRMFGIIWAHHVSRMPHMSYDIWQEGLRNLPRGRSSWTSSSVGVHRGPVASCNDGRTCW